MKDRTLNAAVTLAALPPLLGAWGAAAIAGAQTMQGQVLSILAMAVTLFLVVGVAVSVVIGRRVPNKTQSRYLFAQLGGIIVATMIVLVGMVLVNEISGLPREGKPSYKGGSHVNAIQEGSETI